MQKLLRAALAALFFCAASSALASPALRIGFSPGGKIFEFIEKYEALQQAGGYIEVDGMCLSSCTLFVGLVDHDHVCITPRAVLGFHTATLYDKYSAVGTLFLWNIYPENIKEWLRARGWDGDTPHPDLIWMNNKQLQLIYKPCI